jgi:hypothetical protein
MDDIRLAVRRLVKRPGATIASIVTLACSIGAAAATWSLLDAVLINPLPVRDAERLFVVGQARADGRQSTGFHLSLVPASSATVAPSNVWSRSGRRGHR